MMKYKSHERKYFYGAYMGHFREYNCKPDYIRDLFKVNQIMKLNKKMITKESEREKKLTIILTGGS